MTPMLPMHSLGHKFILAPIHAGGLRYHGMAPLVSHTVEAGLMSPMAIKQLECYEAGLLFARTEGLLVAPETCHAVACAIRSAKQAEEEGKEKTIIFNLSGHGLMDLGGYEKFMAGELQDIVMSAQDVEASRNMSLAGYPVPKI